MFQPDTLLQYVGDVDVSVGFYAGIIGRPPVEHSPGFALFVFPGGRALGLWRRDAVQPIVYGNAGANELAMVVDSPAEVERVYQAWQSLGVVIAQAPVTLEFGHTFVGLDPDGHRLRVYSRSDDLPPRT